MTHSRAMVAACLGLLYTAAAPAYEPHINYMLNCMGCHGPDGRGDAGHVPDIRGTLAPFAANTAGRRFMAQVPGAALSRLSDAELAEVLNWMIGNLATPPPAPALTSAMTPPRTPASQTLHTAPATPFTAQEIAAYRATPLVDVTAARRQLITQLTQHP